MKDENKTKKELIKELSSLRKHVSKLEKLEHVRKQAEKTCPADKGYLQAELNYSLSAEENETAEDFNLCNIVNIEDLQRIQDSFARATGVATIITDVESNPITKPSNFSKVCEIVKKTKKGNERCKMSDKLRVEKARIEKKPIYHKCLSCGLIDASAPIIVEGKHIANWLIGQSNALGVDNQQIREYAVEIGADVDEMLRAYEAIPQMTLEKFKQILDLSWHFAKEISALGYSNLKMIKDITERRRAEKALQESEERFRLIASSISDLIYEWDIATDCLDWFGDIDGALGFEQGEFDRTIEAWLNLIHPGDQKRLADAVNYHRESGDPLKIEYRILHKDGSWRYWLDRGVVIRDDTGKPYKLIGSCTDITRRKLAEDALRENKRKLKSIIEHSNELFYIHDTNDMLTYVSPYSTEIFGYTPEEMMVKWTELITDNPINQIGFELTKKAISTGERQRPYILEIIRKDGEKILIETDESPIKDENGQVVGITGAVRDITDRLKKEEALQESEHKFRTLSELLPECVFETDMKGKLTFANQIAFEKFGYTREDFEKGINFVDTIIPSDRRKAKENVIKVMHGETINANDYKALRKDGTTFDITVYSNPIISDGKAVGLRGIVIDITERKQAEEALRESEEKYRVLFEGYAEPVTILDRDGIILMVNAAGARNIGLSQEESVGKSIFELLSIDDSLHEVYQQVIDTGISVTREDFLELPSGHRWFWSVHQPVSDINDTRYGVQIISYDITERKQAADALSESEQKYRSLTELLPVCVFETDASGKITFANRISFEKFGYKQEDLKKGINFIDVLVPADRDRATRNAAKIMKGEKIGSSEYKALRKNGTVFDVSIHSSPIMKDGKAVGLRGVILDITERKQAALALQASEEKYRILIENASDGIIVAQNGWVKFVNPRVMEIINYTKEELLSTPFVEFIYPDDRERAIEINRKRINGEDTPEVHDLRAIDKEGTLKWLEICGVQITWEGKPASLNFIKNINERKQAEEQLKESEEKFRRIAERIFDVICIVDLHGTTTYISPSVNRVFGYSSKDLIGKKLTAFVPRAEILYVIETFKKTINGKVIEGHHSKFRRKDGTIAQVEVNALPIYKDGKVVGAQAIVRDITETKRLQEFASRAQRLETAGRIAGQVAHDFNNLLGPMIAYPDFIKGDLPENHSAVQLLNDIEKAAGTMADINQQLLTLSRRGHYTLETVSLNDITTQALNQIEMPLTTLFIETDLDQNLMNIKGGSSQILRVISNLVNNARDAMQDKGHLFIRTENYYNDKIFGKYGRIPKGEYAKVTITDTGCGISEDILPKIFDPFYTTKTAEKRRGSGLGLSVVHAVMEDHDSYIDIQTKPGQGTSFYLYFPITRELVETPTSDNIIGGTENILVVDDDTLQREVALNLLIKLGYKAIAVESGEKAIEYLKENSLDLIILDMIMPDGIDGVETYKRALEINPEQKAIIVSGYAETEQVNLAMKLGAGSYIRKPLTMKVIARAVRGELDKVLV